jgi:heme/copper-type cytochrome/quinol oxidase subunit 3
MKGTKLINLLKTFSPGEMKDFGKFVASPYFNSVKIRTKLIKELGKFYPEFESDKLTNEKLYRKLYPGKKFNKQVMWNHGSAMEKIAKEFMEHVALRKNKFGKMELLFSELGNRKLLKDYLQTINEMEELLGSRAIDYDYFENRGHLENYKQEYYHLTDKIQPMSDSKLKATEYQILLFLRMTVGGLHDMTVLKRDYNAQFDVNLPLEFAKHLDLKSIVEYAKSKDFEYTFMIEIYYRSLMMMLEPEESIHFDEVRDLFRMSYERFTMSEKRTIMHWLVAYCVYRSEDKEFKYKRIIFELNKFRLKEGLVFYPEGQIPSVIYLQILKIALSLDEMEWAEDFIKNYTSKLHPGIMQSTRAMAYAFVHFQTKEYDKVLENLTEVEFIDPRDKRFARTLLARTYYEMNELESLRNHIDTSLHFLVNNPAVSELARISHRNFFNALKKIISIKENPDVESIRLLKNELSQSKNTESKNWMLEKLSGLENEI